MNDQNYQDLLDRVTKLEELFGRITSLEQLLSYPASDEVRHILGMPIPQGAGASSLTQSITVPSGGSTFNVPKAYAGTLRLEIEGVQREIPYL